MNSNQRKQFNKKLLKMQDKFAAVLDHIIANYGKDSDVITVEDLKSLRDEMRNPA